MTVRTWMIYGAYGYSGELIAKHARERGLSPVLAGRDAERTEALAAELGLPHRAFPLTDTKRLEAALADIDAVVHCAGPFSATAAPMIDACIAAGTHYFDITGEAFVFEHAHSDAVNDAATRADVIVCPGVGFDVVPTDCVARTLAEAMPDAVSLELAFDGGSRLSPGTAKTMAEGLALGTYGRRDGKLVRTGVLTREIDFGRGPRSAMSISWGDISTAFHSTRIPDITVYIPASPKRIQSAKRIAWIRPLMKLAPVQAYLKGKIERRIRGPSDEERAGDSTRVWGEVRNGAGERLTARLETANGYTVTQLAPVAIIEHLQRADAPSGSLTPSMLMGRDFASALPGSTPIRIVG